MRSGSKQGRRLRGGSRHRHRTSFHVAVLHGSNDLYGASRVLVQDVQVLREMGHRITVVLPADGPLTALLERAGAEVSVAPLRVIRRVDGLRAVRIPGRLPPAARDADVVVLWTLALASYRATLEARRRATVVSVHEILDTWPGGVLARFAVSRGAPVVANSEATAAWLIANGARPENLSISYPAAPVRAPLGPADDGPLRVLIAGRVNGHKGHIEAVRAVARARAAGADIMLMLAGGSFPGQERHLDALLREIDSYEWATYVGEVADVRSLLAKAHVMLVPTITPEPFGVVALEAWAAGRTVIGSNIGGLAEAIRLVDGLLVPAGDVHALAEMLIRVGSDAKLRVPSGVNARVSTVCTLEARRDAWSHVFGRLTSRVAGDSVGAA